MVHASLAFDGGTLVHARSPSAVGEEAVQEIYLWLGGDYIIEHGAATAERTINRRMDLLLSEAESGRAEATQHSKPTGSGRTTMGCTSSRS